MRRQEGRQEITILSRILKNAWKVFGSSGNDTLFVELGKGYFKFCQLSAKKHGRSILHLERIDIPLYEDAAVSARIKDFLNEAKIEKRNVILNIPRHLVTARIVRFPSVNDDEISKMTKVEALKHVPYSDTDLITAHRIIKTSDDGYSDTLMAICQASIISRSTDIIKQAELNVEGAFLSSESLFLWHLASGAALTEGCEAVLNIDWDHTDIDIVKDGKLVFTRGILQDASSEKLQERIVEEMRLSMAAYKKDSGFSVERVIVTGIPSKLETVINMLSDKLAVRVEAVGQFTNISITKEAGSSAGDNSFAELAGGAIRRRELCMNLLPESELKIRRVRDIKRALVVTAGAIALLGFSVVGIVFDRMHGRSQAVVRIESQILKIDPEVSKAKKMQREIDTIRSELARKPLAIDVLTRVYKITPSGILLNLLEFDSGKSLILRGSATDMTGVFEYVKALEKDEYLENVKIKYANKRTGGASENVDFEISCSIIKAGEDVPKKPK